MFTTRITAAILAATLLAWSATGHGVTRPIRTPLEVGMELKHALMDLDELIAGLEARQQRNIEAVREAGPELTDVENARFEVGWGLCRDLLYDLRKMRETWAEGHGAYRRTEQALGHER